MNTENYVCKRTWLEVLLFSVENAEGQGLIVAKKYIDTQFWENNSLALY